MAPLDSNPEDHGHLLGDGIGRMPRGCGKTEDARNSKAAPALVLSGPSSSHILGYAPLEKQATRFFARRKALRTYFRTFDLS